MGQFSNLHFGAVSTSGDVSPCTRPTYATRYDIELIFGKHNVQKWADIDNDGSANDITARVCWALAETYDYFNDRLRGGLVRVPFEEPYAASLVSMSARWAGVLLYESRGITDYSETGRPQHQLSFHRDAVLRYLNDLHAGRIRLNITPHAFTHPQVVK